MGYIHTYIGYIRAEILSFSIPLSSSSLQVPENHARSSGGVEGVPNAGQAPREDFALEGTTHRADDDLAYLDSISVVTLSMICTSSM